MPIRNIRIEDTEGTGYILSTERMTEPYNPTAGDNERVVLRKELKSSIKRKALVFYYFAGYKDINVAKLKREHWHKCLSSLYVSGRTVESIGCRTFRGTNAAKLYDWAMAYLPKKRKATKLKGK